jgi:hypothetical protein
MDERLTSLTNISPLTDALIGLNDFQAMMAV